MPAPSHYEVLGVPEGAGHDEVRRAYLDLARRFHPDALGQMAGADRANAEARMRDVNEAWRVLGNAGRRIAYDAARRRSEPVSHARTWSDDRPFHSGDLFTEPEPPPDLLTRLVRIVPWALLFAALGAIFVFTAYATSTPATARCVQKVGSAAADAPCDAPGARRVVAEVTSVTFCPPGTEAFQPADASVALCLEPTQGE